MSARSGANAGVSFVVHATGVAKAWAKGINEQGGIGGHPVQIVEADDQSQAAAAQAAVKNLVENQGIVATFVIDAFADSATGDYLEQKGVALLGIGYGTDLYSKRTNAFSVTTTLPTLFSAEVAAAKTAGQKKFAAVVCAEAPACKDADQVFRPAAKKAGLGYGGIVTVSAAQPDYTAECLQLIQQHVDFIQLSTAPAVGTRVSEDCLRQGYTGVFGTGGGSATQSDLENTAGGTFEGVMHGFPWFISAAPVKAFRDFMAKYGPDVNYHDPTSTAMYSTLQLLKKALGSPTGDVTKQSVMQAMASVKNETLDGLLPSPMTFTAGQAAPKNTCYWLYKFKVGDKDFQLVPATGTPGNGVQGDLATTCE